MGYQVQARRKGDVIKIECPTGEIVEIKVLHLGTREVKIGLSGPPSVRFHHPKSGQETPKDR